MYLSFVRSNHGRVDGRGICQECDRTVTGVGEKSKAYRDINGRPEGKRLLAS
jgi:hypothetical protein